MFEVEIMLKDIGIISIKYGFDVVIVYKVRNYLINCYLVVVNFLCLLSV